jgi:hypothetical protein
MKRLFLIYLSVFYLSAMFVSCNKENITVDDETDSQTIKSDVMCSKCL